jgi:pyruvate/2-oxoglutarate dehydrogenase complex dihydrolipoamide dehydrogenase (E3) component
MDDHDAIIIGTGQSGPSLARRLVAAGQKVAVIERKFFGGTCVNTGCTPTKTLVASAYAAYLARRAGDYGVTIGGPVRVDMKAVKARCSWSSRGSSPKRDCGHDVKKNDDGQNCKRDSYFH